jgi:hypothetical protein
MIHFACTTTNIAAASASSAAFFTVADWNTYDGFFPSATTCKAGSGSLTVAFRAQCFFWHRLRPTLPDAPFLNLTRRDPHDMDSVADHIGRALLAFDWGRLFRVVPMVLPVFGLTK